MNIKNAEKILGLIFLAWSVVDLLWRDWLGFAIHFLAGAALLFAEKLKLPKVVEIALVVVFLALVVARLAIRLSS